MSQQPAPAAISTPVSVTGVPDFPTSCLGRGEELTRLRRLLLEPGVRVVTITGFGGIGKTRLASAVVPDLVSDFRRIWFVSLPWSRMLPARRSCASWGSKMRRRSPISP